MKTVSLELAKRLKDAGWEKNTHFKHMLWHDTWILEALNCEPPVPWLPAPTLCEVLEELSYLELGAA